MPPPDSQKHIQDLTHSASISDPESFWLNHASHLTWTKPPTRAFASFTKRLPSGSSHPSWSWFPGGEISTSHNCIDRHIQAGRGSATAIIHDSPVTNTKTKISYDELLSEVEALAAVLVDDCGVQRGDTVLIYMPMIPAAMYAMLASSRVGAIHAVVFGGFAAGSLAQRIDACRPKVVVTASCGIEGANKRLSYRGFVEGAWDQAEHKPGKILVWDREQMPWGTLEPKRGELDLRRAMEGKKREGRREKGCSVRSEDGLYIIYTSGTTGNPKGVLRPAGGHAVQLNYTMQYIFGIRGPGDVMFTASDVGWVVGHTYIVYAPLLVGATTVLFEGKPIGTPDAGTFWRIIDEHNVSAFFTAPTALRAIRRDDPDAKFFKERGAKGGLRNLKGMYLAGERSEPSIVALYRDLLAKYCARDAQVVDNWWSSESGSPLTAIATRPGIGKDLSATQHFRALRIKPGAAGKAMPGFDIRCVDDSGKEVPPGTMGNIVMGVPLAPSAFTTLYGDEERFYKSYLKRFQGKWVDTGDAGIIDSDGYVSIMSRADDVINVAAHRFSTGSIEQAITSHPSVAEGCVVGIPDELKGHLPFAFVTLNTPNHPESAIPTDELFKEVNARVRDQIGSIAALGGMIQGKGMIPKTRSGKTLRRTLRELVENAVHGEFEKDVGVPATVEDKSVVDVARAKVKEYFESKGGRHKAIEARAKL